MTTQLDKLLAAQEKATQKKHEAEQQEKRIRKQISDLKDKDMHRFMFFLTPTSFLSSHRVAF